LCYVRDCHFGPADEVQQLLEQATSVGKQLNKFLQAVESSHRSAK
jgi:hypothetical protein